MAGRTYLCRFLYETSDGHVIAENRPQAHFSVIVQVRIGFLAELDFYEIRYIWSVCEVEWWVYVSIDRGPLAGPSRREDREGQSHILRWGSGSG